MPELNSANNTALSSRAVLIAAGGTGGHVFPALAVAAQLKRQGIAVFWVGTRNGIEARLVPDHQFPIDYIQVAGLRGKNVLAWAKAPLFLLIAVLRVRSLIADHNIAVVLGMGGFVSGAAGIAAILARKPLLLQEQNAVPGSTNRYLAPFARRIYTGFAATFAAKKKAVFSGNPLRSAFCNLPSPDQRIDLVDRSVHILVLGGSQGAHALNQIVPESLRLLHDLLDKGSGLSVTHQTGTNDFEWVQSTYRDVGMQAEVSPFIKNMVEAYLNADLVIARSGALTVSELAAVGVASVLVPYPHATDDHQRVNANWLADSGAALVVSQAELNASGLADALRELIVDKSALLAMANRARTVARTDAARLIADACGSVSNE